jgi:virginiamycin B lyase
MLALLLLATPAATTAVLPDTTLKVQIEAWPVPWGGRVRDPFVAPDGRVWFVGQAGNYVAIFDTVTKRFERIEIDDGAHPHTVIVGPDSAAWYAGNQNGTIVRIDPRTHQMRRFPMPSAAVEDPHTMTFDRNGVLWFTSQNGNAIGRLDPRTGEVRALPSPIPRSRPYGIVIDRNGILWADLFGTDQVARIDPATRQLTTVKLPDPRARPRRMATTSDGAVWWGDYSRGKLGRLDPATGRITEYDNPAGAGSLPYAMTSDDRDRLWYIETGPQPNRLVAVDGKTGRVLGTWEVPGGPNVVRNMHFDPRTRSLWFGTDANDLVRVRLDAVGGVAPRV